MPTTSVTVLVVLRDGPRALTRLLVRCTARGWVPVAVRSISDGVRCEVAMRLQVPADRRGTEAQVRTQIARLVDVETVAVGKDRPYDASLETCAVCLSSSR